MKPVLMRIKIRGKKLICTIDAVFFRWYHVNMVWHLGCAAGGEGVSKTMTHTIKGFLSGKRAAFAAILLAVLLAMFPGSGIAALANESPDNDFVTDSSNILLTEPDTSIADIDALLMGSDPAEVVGDNSLKGFSTLAVFSVAAVDDYDFSEIETTSIKGASITADMTVQVRFLPTDGAWEKLDFDVIDGAVNVELPSEGQLAIFVKDDIVIDDEDTDEDNGNADGKTDPGKAPQTGDRLPLYITIACVALAAAGVSYKKIRR